MNVLIVGDDRLLCRQLERLCRKTLDRKLESVKVTTGIAGTGIWADAPLVDLLLLDLNLSGLDALQLLARSVAGPFHTVIFSTHREQALRAFEFGVLDFVPKPINAERLAEALRRATDQDARAGIAAKFLAIKKSGEVGLIPVKDVLYARAVRHTCELVLTDGRCEAHDKSLERLQSILPPAFERLHGDFLVRRDAMKTFLPSEEGRGEAELKNGDRVPVDFRSLLRLGDQMIPDFLMDLCPGFV